MSCGTPFLGCGGSLYAGPAPALANAIVIALL